MRNWSFESSHNSTNRREGQRKISLFMLNEEGIVYSDEVISGQINR